MQTCVTFRASNSWFALTTVGPRLARRPFDTCSVECVRDASRKIVGKGVLASITPVAGYVFLELMWIDV